MVHHDNLTYLFYSCPLHFWQNYFKTMLKILSIWIKISPHIFLSGLPEDYNHYTTVQLEVPAFTF